MPNIERQSLLPEKELPDAKTLIAEGRRLAESHPAQDCPFLSDYHIRSESEYKRRCMAEGRLMLHAQVGYRSLEHSRKAYAQIYQQVAKAGYRVDRYGICLDWSMGYPAAMRAEMPRGTGLILNGEADFRALTQEAPVAAHFGDFVMGTPAALENTLAALAAGATSIGNLGQYFTFRMPRWSDDVGITAETVKALALCAAQTVEVLIHSNLDDGFASLFRDMASAIGAALIEKHIVDELVGGRVSHCYGHTFSDPLTRLAFQRALRQVNETPGTMVYGNTTIYVEGEVENYANLASYLLVDILAQQALPSGHGLNPVPTSEAMHIPEIEEIVAAHLFANRLIQRADGYSGLVDMPAVDRVTERLVQGGRQFKENILAGLAEAGIDTGNPFELLLAIRRLGARRLEEAFGPGSGAEGKRTPLVRATTLNTVEVLGEQAAQALNPEARAAIGAADFCACVTCTDVHEYGKVLVETALERLGVRLVDAGVSAEPEAVAAVARQAGADFIAISTYSGVALSYLQAVRKEMDRLGYLRPVFIGGKLNQVDEASGSSLPVDVTGALQDMGAIACARVEEMLSALADMAEQRRLSAQ